MLGLIAALPLFASVAQVETLTTTDVSRERCVELKDPASCFELGVLYIGASKPKKGEPYILKGCELEQGKKCSLEFALERANFYSQSAKDLDRQKQKLLEEQSSSKMSTDEINCEKGDAESCHKAGIFYFYLSTPVNSKKGKEMFEMGCTLEHADSCESLRLINKGIVKVYNVDAG